VSASNPHKLHVSGTGARDGTLGAADSQSQTFVTSASTELDLDVIAWESLEGTIARIDAHADSATSFCTFWGMIIASG
jgi:hypothetical protein